jgi:hypothetical protein
MDSKATANAAAIGVRGYSFSSLSPAYSFS